MPETRGEFDWPMILETSRSALVGSKVFESYLEENRARNATSWNQPAHWKFGFYFGGDDSRLWVPRRLRNGMAADEERVINFGHTLGKRAFRILMFGYGTAALTVLAVLAAALGVRW